jgi:hypothetical protein
VVVATEPQYAQRRVFGVVVTGDGEPVPMTPGVEDGFGIECVLIDVRGRSLSEFGVVLDADGGVAFLTSFVSIPLDIIRLV